MFSDKFQVEHGADTRAEPTVEEIHLALARGSNEKQVIDVASVQADLEVAHEARLCDPLVPKLVEACAGNVG